MKDVMVDTVDLFISVLGNNNKYKLKISIKKLVNFLNNFFRSKFEDVI
jgi:hypothetical protein